MWSGCQTHPTGLCAWRPDADLYNTWRLDVDLSNTGRPDGDLLITDNMEMFLWYQVRERSLDQPRSDTCKPSSDNTNIRAVDLRVKTEYLLEGSQQTSQPCWYMWYLRWPPSMPHCTSCPQLTSIKHHCSYLHILKTPLGGWNVCG